jgi:hypothetical protein
MTVAVLYDKLLGRHHLVEIDELTISNDELQAVSRVLYGKNTVFYGLVHMAEWDKEEPRHFSEVLFERIARCPQNRRGYLFLRLRKALCKTVLQEFGRFFPSWLATRRMKGKTSLQTACETLFG